MSRRLAAATAVAALSACAPAAPAPEAPDPEEDLLIERPGDVPPIAVAPEGAIIEGGIARLQRALAERGFPLEPTDRLDPPTQSALRVFQARQGLAATGMPDMETLRRLDLPPKALYRGRR